MSGFIERILSGKYPRLESLWKTEFEKLFDEVFNNIDLSDDDVDGPDLDSEWEGISADSEVQALRADLSRVESLLAEERARCESTKRELGVVKAELKSARYQLDAVAIAIGGRRIWHDEPIG